MAHKLEIRARGGGKGWPAVGFNTVVLLDGRELEWMSVELSLSPADSVSVTLKLPLRELDVDADVIVALQAMADKRTSTVPSSGRVDDAL